MAGVFISYPLLDFNYVPDLYALLSSGNGMPSFPPSSLGSLLSPDKAGGCSRARNVPFRGTCQAVPRGRTWALAPLEMKSPPGISSMPSQARPPALWSVALKTQLPLCNLAELLYLVALNAPGFLDLSTTHTGASEVLYCRAVPCLQDIQEHTDLCPLDANSNLPPSNYDHEACLQTLLNILQG